ncbi:glycosyl transferase family 2 [Lachnotalea glycerini]|uniref:Glycosyl transferase family 2 n=1 Tax=Lachnotalea glycerini TaxID=1763509 RepID=A0A255IDB4_9FIRM|nr:glycosyltransferase [Lachnotalea glycerini]PXV90316.1 glycosyl transferase family 2 [Lachnotalea glycerini]RDY26684.1 glycosyltransferase [Lachnotalea glycerini]
MKNPLIGVYGIYKNEQGFMKRFLESVQTADEIVLCDTGTTDDTNDMIQNFIKNNPNVKIKMIPICISPWRFDDARNAALSLVSPEIDICISLNIDEYLMEHWREHLIRQWEEGITSYYHKYKTFWPDGSISEQLYKRIHIRDGYTWKLPIHEMLEYKSTENTKTLQDFCIYYTPIEKIVKPSDISLLEQSVMERKDIWMSWSFLADGYLKAGRYEAASKAIDTALEIKNCDKAFLYKQKYNIDKFQNKMETALFYLNTAIFYMPKRRELYVEKAKFLSEIGRNMEAYTTILEAANKNEKIIDYHYNPFAWEDTFDRFKENIYSLAKKEGLEL